MDGLHDARGDDGSPAIRSARPATLPVEAAPPSAGSAGPGRAAVTPRREHILAAAEACFVRHGFHRTTMQDIAREAAMSPANIYRYFASKEDVVLSLAAGEAWRAEEILAQLDARGDPRAELSAIIDAYFVQASPEAAILRLEIWSEVTRHPRLVALAREQEALFQAWFTGALAALAASPACDVSGLWAVACALLRGILVGKALSPDYDSGPVAAHLHALIEAGLAGPPVAPPSRPEPSR